MEISSLIMASILIGFMFIIKPSISTSLSNHHLDQTNYQSSRKLLVNSTIKADRAWGWPKCSQSDIVLTQGQTTPLPNGIPTYTVEISNVCVTGCDISDIHLSCGWFSSARLINPKVFRRIKYNDCVVNHGKPLLSGETLSFTYANTHCYPLSISTFKC